MDAEGKARLHGELARLEPDSGYTPQAANGAWMAMLQELNREADREALELCLRLILRHGVLLLRNKKSWTQARAQLCGVDVDRAQHMISNTDLIAAVNYNAAIVAFQVGKDQLALAYLRAITNKPALQEYWPQATALWARMCIEAGLSVEAERFIERVDGKKHVRAWWWPRYAAVLEARDTNTWHVSLGLDHHDLMWV